MPSFTTFFWEENIPTESQEVIITSSSPAKKGIETMVFQCHFSVLVTDFEQAKARWGTYFSPFSSQSFTLFSKMWLVLYNCWLATFACPVYVALHQYFCLSKHQNLNILNVCIVILTVSCNILQNLSNEI